MVYYHPALIDNDNSSLSLRSQLLQVSQKLVNLGLNRGTSGNCSARFKSGILLTPSGLAVEEMVSTSIVEINMSGEVVGSGKPSSEWRFHRDILQNRPDVGAIIHTHSMFATTLACLHKDIPPFHYMIAVSGGDTIRCAPYSLFGSQDISNGALKALEGRKACLLANHGMIALGRDLDDALSIAIEVENLSEQYYRVLQIGSPQILSVEQMNDVIEQFKGYGKWSSV